MTVTHIILNEVLLWGQFEFMWCFKVIYLKWLNYVEGLWLKLFYYHTVARVTCNSICVWYGFGRTIAELPRDTKGYFNNIERYPFISGLWQISLKQRNKGNNNYYFFQHVVKYFL